MPELPREIIKPKLLIGEGKEEERFFGALLTHLGIGDVQVEQYGGKQGLASYLKNLLVRPGYPALVSLGVTRDADISAREAFQSVYDTLRNIGLSTPDRPQTSATGRLRVGVFILPDGQRSGMLEDLCLSAIQAYPEWGCIEAYFQCITATANRQPANMSKARVHVWLASQVEADKQLGVAAEIGYWPWDNPPFDALKQFLRAL